MTINTTIHANFYNGNGTDYTGSFKIYDTSDVVVYTYDTLSDTLTKLILTTDYTVSGLGNENFTVTLTSEPPSTTKVILIRDTPTLQETDFLLNGALSSESLEKALDHLAMIDQSQQFYLSRALSFSKVHHLDSLSPTLPTLSDDEVGQTLVLTKSDGKYGIGFGEGIYTERPDSSTDKGIAYFSDDTGKKLASSKITVENDNDLSNVNNLSAGAIVASSIGKLEGTLKVQGLNMPSADGTANQAMVTDGSKNLSFASFLQSTGAVEDENVLTFSGGKIQGNSGVQISSQNQLTISPNDNQVGLVISTANLTSNHLAAIALNDTTDTKYVSISAPETLDETYNITFPTKKGGEGNVLFKGSGNDLKWAENFRFFDGGQLRIEPAGNLFGIVITSKNSAPGSRANIRLYDETNLNTIDIGPTTLTESYSFQFPSGKGSAGQVLQTDGTGKTSWVTIKITDLMDFEEI